jgi:RHS repeat-associated protein
MVPVCTPISSVTARQPFSRLGNTALWAGVHRDPHTGWDWMGARVYLPALRQFLSRDPAGYAVSTDEWAYAPGDPWSFVDPTGWSPLKYGNAKQVGGATGRRPGGAIDDSPGGFPSPADLIEEATNHLMRYQTGVDDAANREFLRPRLTQALGWLTPDELQMLIDSTYRVVAQRRDAEVAGGFKWGPESRPGENVKGSTRYYINMVQTYTDGEATSVIAIVHELFHVLSDLHAGDLFGFMSQTEAEAFSGVLDESYLHEADEWEVAYQEYLTNRENAPEYIEVRSSAAAPGYSATSVAEFYAEVNTVFRTGSAFDLAKIYVMAPTAWRMLSSANGQTSNGYSVPGAPELKWEIGIVRGEVSGRQ